MAVSGVLRDISDRGRPYQPGSDADFERLYVESYPKILGTLTVILGDRPAAEDCTQDAFERAFKKWDTWQPIAPPEAWVNRIAINAALSYKRKMRLREAHELVRRVGRPGIGPDPQKQVDRLDLVDALGQLPPKEAKAIVLRHYHGYTNRAIGKALGVPERTVASQLWRAKGRLRVQLMPVESVATKTVVQTSTVTVGARRGASRASGRRITRRPEANKQHRR
ncbi:MAG: RNA polymerase sigma factor [Solirubrobacteraceae bacterium]